jgi:MoxR-like ATPase
MSSDWLIYRGSDEPHDGIARLPEPPPWRSFGAVSPPPQAMPGHPGWTASDVARGQSYNADDALLAPVNAALYLRRPLLVTGLPGVGKSTLAYSAAWELGLRPVLRWPVTSSSTVKDGLYRYDAIGRLQDVNLKMLHERTSIGRYVRLGPLGTALLPSATPRVLLIDEIDKADIDLPNDLLSTFEEGEFEIPELARIADLEPDVNVSTADGTEQVSITGGKVRCLQFPFVIMTSNGEREFPGAFLRRCLRLNIEPPDPEQLAAIVAAQLGLTAAEDARELIAAFCERAENGDLATDQLLNAVLLTCRTDLEVGERADLVELLFQYLSPELA